MAIGSMNVSNNSKINNEIKALQNKDIELNSVLETKAEKVDVDLFAGLFPSNQIKDTYIECPKNESITVNIADIKCNALKFTILIKGCLPSLDHTTFKSTNFFISSNSYASYKAIIRATRNRDGSTYTVSNIKYDGNQTDYNIKVTYDSDTMDFTITNYGYWATNVEILTIPTVFESISPIFGSSLYDINNMIGSTDISSIGNGTITDAINELNAQIKALQNS